MSRLPRFIFLSLLPLLTLLPTAQASLRIDAAEWIVAKFHRADAKLHPHTFNHAWAPYILPEAAEAPGNNGIFVQYQGKIGDHESYTVFFKTFADLLDSITRLAKEKNDTVAILNLHSHGLPGGQWVPKDQAALKSLSCYQWKTIADGADDASYRGYYAIPSKADIEGIRRLGEHESGIGCTVGRRQWADLLDARPEFVKSLNPDVQVSFLSCVVGLGPVGARFLQELTDRLIPVNGQGRIQASVNYGLGDWSMDTGMGFWDYLTDEQLARDSATYQSTKKDLDVAQLGSLLVGLRSGGRSVTGLIHEVSLMKLTGDIPAPAKVRRARIPRPKFATTLPKAKETYRIPGTDIRVSAE